MVVHVYISSQKRNNKRTRKRKEKKKGHELEKEIKVLNEKKFLVGIPGNNDINLDEP